MAMYSRPASRAAARHRRGCRPCRRSRCVCMCRSPRRSARSMSRGSACGCGRLDLAAHLAQLGRHPVEAERLVDLFLVARRRPRVVGDAKQPVFVQLEAQADGAIAQRDVVRLRAGEVLHARRRGSRRRPAAGRPEIRRDSRTLDFVSPWPSTRSTQRVVDEGVHQRRRRRRRRGCRCRRTCRSRAAGCRPASIVAPRRPLAQIRDERRGGVVRVGQQMPAGVPLALVERLEDQRFLLRRPCRAARGSRPSFAARSRSSSVRMPSSR